MEAETFQIGRGKIKATPTMRFEEFKGNWKSKRLSEVSNIERGRFSPRPRNNPIYYGGEIPFVQTGDVLNAGGKVNSYSQTLNEQGLAVSKKFDKGTILITIAANIGYSGVLEIDMACPDSLVGISCRNVHNYFLNYRLELEQPRMDYLAVAAAQKNINLDFLRPYKFFFPSLPEQQKIASFLSAVDKKIQHLTRKKELLETYNKGVMQQLFSRKIRFKQEDGKDYPDWKEITLDEISTFSKGKGVSKNDICEGGSFSCIRYGELYTYYGETIENPISRTDVGKEDLVLSQAGDVIIPASGETRIDIATASCILQDGIAIGGDLNIIRGNFNGVFLAYFLNNHLKNDIARLSQGSSVIHLYSNQLKKLRLRLPCIQEQQKIADSLSVINKKIEAVLRQIERTRTFKKGLLQQMFV